MNRRLLLPVLLVLFAVVGGSAGFLLGGWLYDNPPAPAGVDQVAIGEPVPDWTLADVDGRAVRLADSAGRLRIVNYWASWCPPCIEEMPMLDAWAARQGDAVAVLGIAEDDEDAVRGFLDQHPVAYPILLGRRELAGSSLQVGNSRGVLPYTVVVGADGRLLERRAGLLDEARLDDWLARFGAGRR